MKERVFTSVDDYLDYYRREYPDPYPGKSRYYRAGAESARVAAERAIAAAKRDKASPWQKMVNTTDR